LRIRGTARSRSKCLTEVANDAAESTGRLGDAKIAASSTTGTWTKPSDAHECVRWVRRQLPRAARRKRSGATAAFPRLQPSRNFHSRAAQRTSEGSSAANIRSSSAASLATAERLRNWLPCWPPSSPLPGSSTYRIAKICVLQVGPGARRSISQKYMNNQCLAARERHFKFRTSSSTTVTSLLQLWLQNRLMPKKASQVLAGSSAARGDKVSCTLKRKMSAAKLRGPSRFFIE